VFTALGIDWEMVPLAPAGGLVGEHDVEEGGLATGQHRPQASRGTPRPELALDEAQVTQCLTVVDETAHR
jgi:hypothetical protein